MSVIIKGNEINIGTYILINYEYRRPVVLIYYYYASSASRLYTQEKKVFETEEKVMIE